MAKFDPVADQRAANASALGHYEAFSGHREKLTELALSRAPNAGGGTLCVLGAGNCFDLDVNRLAAAYGEIHLVDIDVPALRGTVDRHAPEVQAKLHVHGGVDLSGLLDRLDRWARGEITVEELTTHGDATARAVAQQLGRQFDVVLSACVLSQMQLSVVDGLGDGHRLIPVVSWTLTVTHFLTLAALTRSGGSALFATDITASPIYPSLAGAAKEDGLTLLNDAVRARKVFDFAEPGRVEEMMRDNPTLQAALGWQLTDAWTWDNGPHVTFLVYAVVMPRR